MTVDFYYTAISKIYSESGVQERAIDFSIKFMKHTIVPYRVICLLKVNETCTYLFTRFIFNIFADKCQCFNHEQVISCSVEQLSPWQLISSYEDIAL